MLVCPAIFMDTSWVCNFLADLLIREFFALLLADVIAFVFGRCHCLVLIWYMLQPPGRCYACSTVAWQMLLLILFILVADVIAIMVVWLMLLPFDVSCCGRCYCQR